MAKQKLRKVILTVEIPLSKGVKELSEDELVDLAADIQHCLQDTLDCTGFCEYNSELNGKIGSTITVDAHNEE